MLRLFCPLLVMLAAPLLAEEPPLHERYPHHLLDNGRLRAWVMLPDAERAMYRAVRFDWAGIVTYVECDGRTFFGPLHDEHDPFGQDHVMGLAEEFGIDAPAGYEEARGGGTFLKIGVGILRRPAEEETYRFWGRYEVADPGQWRIEAGDRSIDFHHTVSGEAGWGYEYVKRVELSADAPRLTIRRTLRNTGARPIETDHYGHHFMQIEGATAGPEYQVDLPFEAAVEKYEGTQEPPLAELKDRSIRFIQPVAEGQSAKILLGGFDQTADHHGFVVRHLPTGAAMAARGDRPLSRFAFWSNRRVVCPEPFIAVRLAPGEQMQWSTEYTFTAGGWGRD